ncbi:hypothetical protein CPJCM30710_30570 [Clostridium polyendosporum]|uniref:Uncharacterized protein n=1 Tax=Clostridium polyendosporum TaxID=69208 RepID=A0A919VI43_9CLOT|nr:hypothetical protein CPJCM30710_30570 [Clostridium polyendosporum]
MMLAKLGVDAFGDKIFQLMENANRIFIVVEMLKKHSLMK